MQSLRVAKSALSVSFGSWVKIVSEEHLKQAVSEIAAAAVGDAAKEVASASLGAIAGRAPGIAPGIRSNRGWRKSTPPSATGLREATQALAIHPTSKRDIQVVDERLASADAELARALSLVPQRKDSWKTSVYIQLLRGLIAKRRGAEAVANTEFDAVLSTTRVELNRLAKLVAERARGFEELQLAVRRGHPGGMQAEINFVGYVNEAKRELTAIQHTCATS